MAVLKKNKQIRKFFIDIQQSDDESDSDDAKLVDKIEDIVGNTVDIEEQETLLSPSSMMITVSESD